MHLNKIGKTGKRYTTVEIRFRICTILEMTYNDIFPHGNLLTIDIARGLDTVNIENNDLEHD